MKKVIVLIAAVLVTGLCSMNASAQKIGYVSMQELVTSMPEYAKADTTLAEFQKELGQQNQVMQQEWQSKVQSFVKDSTTMSEVVKQARQADLRDLQNRMVQFQQNAPDMIQQKQAALLQPIVEKARTAVQAVAKEKGYPYVMDNSADLLIAHPAGDDLTAAVKAKLGIK